MLRYNFSTKTLLTDLLDRVVIILVFVPAFEAGKNGKNEANLDGRFEQDEHPYFKLRIIF